MNYSVYILSNKPNGTLYIGVTNNLKRRVWEHKNKLSDGFTKKYSLENLVYYELFESIKNAIKREKQLKKYNREWKIRLIRDKNELWSDLYSQL